MGNRVKGIATVQVDNIHCLSLVCWVCHFVIEADQVDQREPAFHKPMLAGTDALVYLCVLCGGILGVLLLHDLPRTEDDADRFVIPLILLLATENYSDHVHHHLSTLAAWHLALWTRACLSGVTHHSLLDNGDSIPLPLPDFQLIVLGTLMTASLSIKDWGEEGTEYLSLFLICHISSPIP